MVKRMRRILATAAAASLVVLSLTACAPSRPDSCLTAKPGAIDKLWSDIETTVPGAKKLGVGVAPSDSSDLTFIAVKFNDGKGDYTGVWATTQDPTKDEDVAFIAVDGVAKVSGSYQQPAEFAKTGATIDAAETATKCIS